MFLVALSCFGFGSKNAAAGKGTGSQSEGGSATTTQEVREERSPRRLDSFVRELLLGSLKAPEPDDGESPDVKDGKATTTQAASGVNSGAVPSGVAAATSSAAATTTTTATSTPILSPHPFPTSISTASGGTTTQMIAAYPGAFLWRKPGLGSPYAYSRLSAEMTGRLYAIALACAAAGALCISGLLDPILERQPVFRSRDSRLVG